MVFSLNLAFALLSVLQISGVLCADTSMSADDFYVGTEKVNRAKARKMCEKKSMKLLSIENFKKNNLIVRFLQKRGINNALWTSGKGEWTGKIWVWLNGDEVGFTSWAPNEPNAAGDSAKCIEVFLNNNNLLWNDHSCKDKRGYICEKRTKDDPTSYKTKEFYISTDMAQASRDDAVKECEGKSMTLASIIDDDENDDLYDLIHETGSGSPAYWTSGGRLPDPSVQLEHSYLSGFQGMPWTWLDGSIIREVSWNENEPNSGKGERSCIEVYVVGDTLRWNDHNCDVKRKYVCERYL